MHIHAVRAMSTSGNPETVSAAGIAQSSAPVESISQTIVPPAPTAIVDSVADAAVAAAESVDPLSYWPSHFLIQGIEHMHSYAGLPYWATIVGMTLILRTVLLPVAIKTV